MPNIKVSDGNSNSFVEQQRYFEIGLFVQQMKYIHGNDFVNSTLRRHSKILNFLTDYEKKHILDLEREIDLGVNDESSSNACDSFGSNS